LLTARSLGRALPLLFLAAAGYQGRVVAQDVELLARIHGTRPPPGYYDVIRRDPTAFSFKRAMIRRGLRIRDLPDRRGGGAALTRTYQTAFAEAMQLGPDRAPVSGSFRFPLILGLYSDSPPGPPEFSRDQVQQEFWDGPQMNPSAVGTIPDYYAEVSGGRVTLTGTTFDWQSVPLSEMEVAAGQNGLGPGSRVGEFIVRILEALDDGTVDWGQFDNDGPDGVPNSGDDDGYVDILTVMHPNSGGECRGSFSNDIWSHHWYLYNAAWWDQNYWGSAWDAEVRESILANDGYVTQTPSLSPGVDFIHVDDFTVQPVQRCRREGINHIGVFAHELGHGFGLPDLYVTASGQPHMGIGNWGLMGTGSWGCDSDSPYRPCHMSAWSKEFLGWADVEVLEAGTDLGMLTLLPVETSEKIYRIESGDGSPEYFLVENRQPYGFDSDLYRSGVLIWHIDPVIIQAKRSSNSINNDPDRMGVWLRQADGLNELATRNDERGDAGDPFPGTTWNTVFHAGSNPASWTHGGGAAGVTLLDIQAPVVGGDASFRTLTRFQTLTIRTEGSPSGGGLIFVDGVPPQASEETIESAPFQTHTIEAVPGEEVSEGVRVAFQGWTDGAPRVRQHTTQLEDASFTAQYGGLEYFFDLVPTSPAQGITPGTIDFSAGDGMGWVPENETVTVTAVPQTGFAFSQWTGGFSGLPNPATVTATAPVEGEARFQVTFSAASNPPTLEVYGGATHELMLQAVNGNPPVSWHLISGSLPFSMSLDPQGTISGVPLERGDGEFFITLQARDAIGLTADLPLTLVVEDPPLPIETLAGPFLLTGGMPDGNQRQYLDREGNQNGAYDLGDLRAFVLRNPALALTNELPAVVKALVPLGEFPLKPPPGEVKREEMP
jgi:M6 family metalloprotease-like protein